MRSATRGSGVRSVRTVLPGPSYSPPCRVSAGGKNDGSHSRRSAIIRASALRMPPAFGSTERRQQPEHRGAWITPRAHGTPHRVTWSPGHLVTCSTRAWFCRRRSASLSTLAVSHSMRPAAPVPRGLRAGYGPRTPERACTQALTPYCTATADNPPAHP